MELTTLKSKLKYFIEHLDDVSIVVYAIKRNSYDAVKLDIDSSSLPDLKKIFIEQVKEKIINDEDISLIKYSNADERRNVVYEFDVDLPEELECLNVINNSETITLFNFNVYSIKDIKALIIHIGNANNQLILYKTHAPINTFDRKKMYLIRKTNRLVLIEEDFLRVTPTFQLLYTADTLFILDLKAVERLFGFNDVIFKEARLALPAVEQLSVVANPEIFEELVCDLRYARKLLKIADNSPVLKNRIPAEQIVAFCKKHPHLKKVFKFDEGGTKLILKSKKSKDEFLKILRDDWLTSELTEQEYESKAKDPVLVENRGG